MPIYYSLGLLIIFYLLLVGEFFVPSGGLVGAGACVAAITAIIIAFTHSSSAGLAVTVVVVASTPVVLLFMIRLWPHTPIGRRMLNRRPGQLAPEHSRMMPDGTPIGDWIGRIGTAKTDLLPSGLVTIGDKKLDAISTGMPIDAGTAVIVIKTHGRQIQVRAAQEEEIKAAHDESSAPPPASESPLESLDLESLE